MALTRIIAPLLLVALAACESTYYNAMEGMGVHKRDILVDRIEDTQEAQREGQEQFKDALEQFRSVVNFDGGDLEEIYERLNDEYESSEAAADRIRDRIDSVESVAEALFDEWEDELEEYKNESFRRNSEKQLKDTRRRYEKLMRTMRGAEKTLDPVLDTFKDNVLYLKHNLNARAIASLKGELASVNDDVESLIKAMEVAIAESDSFISNLKE